MEITLEELRAMPAGSYVLVDTRGEGERAYGAIPGSVTAPESPQPGVRYVLYCRRGLHSQQLAEEWEAEGLDAVSLQGGYNGWLMDHLARQEQEEDDLCRRVEDSLRRRFRKSIWSQFTKALRQYQLIRPNDRIAVCLSGGKDSMLLAKLFQELHQHTAVPFEMEFLCMDPGYSPENRRLIEDNARRLGVPLHIFESDIFDSVFHVEKNPCYLCARMRRGHLYEQARRLGCNKIALGHHYDDVIETTLMGMLYGAQIQGMMPKLKSTNFAGMELIRPLYLVREDDIKKWRDANGLRFLQCACRFTDTCSVFDDNEETRSKRQETKRLIRQLKKTNPDVEARIFRSLENVNLDTVIGWKTKGKKHSFLEEY